MRWPSQCLPLINWLICSEWPSGQPAPQPPVAFSHTLSSLQLLLQFKGLTSDLHFEGCSMRSTPTGELPMLSSRSSVHTSSNSCNLPAQHSFSSATVYTGKSSVRTEKIHRELQIFKNLAIGIILGSTVCSEYPLIKVRLDCREIYVLSLTCCRISC